MKKVIIILAILLMTLAGCQYVPISGNMTNATNETTSNESFFPGLNITDSEEETTEDNETVANPSTSDLPTKIINEGDLVEFKQDLAYDPDGDELEYSFSSPLSADGTWQTQIGDAGEYIVSISVSDGELESTTQARLIVQAVNNKPELSGLEDITVDEGETIQLDFETSDEDGDPVTVSISGFMNSEAKVTDFEDAGEYDVTVTANDGKQSTSKTISVTVNNVNRPPTISGLTDVTVTEGEIVSLSPSATDPDGDAVSITFSQPLNENGVWETQEGDAGTYSVDVTASDGEDQVVEEINVVVVSLNSAPTLSIADTITVNEGEMIELNPQVSDEDGDSLKITYSGYMNSATKQTGYEDAGEYEVIITVTDGTETVSKTVTIVIENTNRPPQFNEEDLFA